MEVIIATTKDIGRILYPRDNSYSQDLSTGTDVRLNKGIGLAGNVFTEALPVKIISPPYKMNITNIVNEQVIHNFVIVEYNNQHYIVLNIFTTSPVVSARFIDY